MVHHNNRPRDIDGPSSSGPLGEGLDAPQHRRDSIDTPYQKYLSQAPHVTRTSPSPSSPSSSFSPPFFSPHVKVKRRSWGVQTEVPSREYISPQARASQAPEHFKQGWLHRPKTVFTLCVSLGLIFLASHFVSSSSSDGLGGVDTPGLKQRIFCGSFAALFMFLVFATLQLPDGFLVRPSPIFWRFVKGCSVLYLLLLVFLLFQDLKDVRQGLKSIDPSLGRPLPEKNYAHNCHSVTTLQESLDVFVLAHFLGWLVKALIIRDARLLWILSVLFEFMEISLRHILPNFWECWWDHLILDIFGCNFLGLYLGLCLCRYFQMKEYCWHKCGESMAPLENDGDTLQEEEEYFNCGFSSSSSSSSRKLKNVDENKEVTFSQEIEKDEEDGSSSSFSDKGMRSSTTPSKGDTEREREGEEDHEEERRLGQRSCCRSPSDRLASSPSHRHEGCQGGHVSRKFFHLLMPSHLQQFTPYEWTGYKWPQFFSSAPTFLSLLVFCVAVTLVDLNVFFLKAELWIEPSHWLILLRLTLWTFMAAAGTREYYDFLTDVNCKRLGVQCWIDLAVVSTEALLSYHWANSLQPHDPCPTWVLRVWIGVGISIAIIILLLLVYRPSKSSSSSSPFLSSFPSYSFSLSASSSFVMKTSPSLEATLESSSSSSSARTSPQGDLSTNASYIGDSQARCSYQREGNKKAD